MSIHCHPCLLHPIYNPKDSAANCLATFPSLQFDPHIGEGTSCSKSGVVTDEKSTCNVTPAQHWSRVVKKPVNSCHNWDLKILHDKVDATILLSVHQRELMKLLSN
uniref:Uncharacterized protein n=1 Tax=Odontella aurita TaxID=265563 RepID=A0A7S4IXK9_9STRA|mmetsp:Transcript_32065/g.96084  ORF Transcript_32065/g.96084 Transcript_32065/m.96084 type:complete len:106 (+) Transcript_32065:630-947(+)